MSQDSMKKAAACYAMSWLEPQLTSSTLVGVGTGSTVNFFIAQLAEHRHNFKGAIASSKQTERLLGEYHIPVFELNEVEQLDAYIDGADEIDTSMSMIKGGGAALTREKIVAAVATTFVCIADTSKQVKVLGKFPLPVEVIPMAREYVVRELKKLGGKALHREGVITDNGNHILDVHGLKITQPQVLEQKINQIVGVVTNGLFAHRAADIAFLADAKGVSAQYAKAQ